MAETNFPPSIRFKDGVEQWLTLKYNNAKEVTARGKPTLIRRVETMDGIEATLWPSVTVERILTQHGFKANDLVGITMIKENKKETWSVRKKGGQPLEDPGVSTAPAPAEGPSQPTPGPQQTARTKGRPYNLVILNPVTALDDLLDVYCHLVKGLMKQLKNEWTHEMASTIFITARDMGITGLHTAEQLDARLADDVDKLLRDAPTLKVLIDMATGYKDLVNTMSQASREKVRVAFVARRTELLDTEGPGGDIVDNPFAETLDAEDDGMGPIRRRLVPMLSSIAGGDETLMRVELTAAALNCAIPPDEAKDGDMFKFDVNQLTLIETRIKSTYRVWQELVDWVQKKMEADSLDAKTVMGAEKPDQLSLGNLQTVKDSLEEKAK